MFKFSPMNSQTFLNFSLGIGFLILVVFLCVALVYLIKILRDTHHVTEKMKHTADRIDKFVVDPLIFINKSSGHITDFVKNIFLGKRR